MSSKRLWLTVLACSAVAGCNTAQTHIGDESATLGEAFRYDAAVQIINPAPVYAANSTQPGSNGDVGANAVKRYRSDKVKQPASQQTSTSVTGGGGGGPQ